jgi:tRNA uridine 5-carboxymethylaminomethyl modification enzyme
MKDYDALVVGGGHAGIEAALALARLGHRSLMITQSLDSIGRLSCNPAVGGLSKGNIVREVDALGGEMGKLIDSAMIQFRILNRRRGPAVQAPRAQADKFLYNLLAKETLERQKGLDLLQDTVVDLLLEPSEDGSSRTLTGVRTERGSEISARVVVLTTGTFMEGKVFIGPWEASSGRLGEPAAIGLGPALRAKGFRLGRMKTGTPARVSAMSLDYSKMEEQKGDEEMLPFSFSHEAIDRPQVSCWITFTNENSHRIISENIGTSPLYGGKIVGKGPRYCPSIEDKVVRFPDRERHQIFVEPEGIGTGEMYLNGISSSLSEEVQERFIHSIEGLEDAHIMRPGYAVEYDYMDPLQLFPTLESKLVKGLYVAGQTNGTSGYEEAACQGLLAGINAASALSGEEALILSRAQAYAGVLVDDLVTLGTEEPYRMFTSRAEYRLNLRHDSADRRLLPIGRKLGLQSEEAMEALQRKIEGQESIKQLLRERRLSGAEALNCGFEGQQGKQLYEVLKVPGVEIETVAALQPALGSYPKKWLQEAALDIRYEGYIRRQEEQVQRFSRMEELRISPDFDWESIEGICSESREKFRTVKPLSLGQASRISGVRASDIAVLMVKLKGRKK